MISPNICCFLLSVREVSFAILFNPLTKEVILALFFVCWLSSDLSCSDSFWEIVSGERGEVEPPEVGLGVGRAVSGVGEGAVRTDPDGCLTGRPVTRLGCWAVRFPEI